MLFEQDSRDESHCKCLSNIVQERQSSKDSQAHGAPLFMALDTWPWIPGCDNPDIASQFLSQAPITVRDMENHPQNIQSSIPRAVVNLTPGLSQTFETPYLNYRALTSLRVTSTDLCLAPSHHVHRRRLYARFNVMVAFSVRISKILLSYITRT